MRAHAGAVEAFGHVDAVVHLVVGGFAMGALVEETSEAELERMLDVNLRTAWTVARVVMPYFRARRAGRLAVMGSRIVEEPAARTAWTPLR
jgi:NADP-dependent 3-hydroxy acid dehydrogenase YdfG